MTQSHFGFNGERVCPLFKLFLENNPYDFGLDYKQLADMTHVYVSADIRLIVNDVSRNALRLHSKITMDM